VKTLAHHRSLNRGNAREIWDIEDLVQLGKKAKGKIY